MKTVLLVALILIAIGLAANAQQNCAPRPVLVERLQGVYGESVQSRSLGDVAPDVIAVFETWANVDTGTWSWALTTADGQMCLRAAGTGFERMDKAPAPMGQGG